MRPDDGGNDEAHDNFDSAAGSCLTFFTFRGRVRPTATEWSVLFFGLFFGRVGVASLPRGPTQRIADVVLPAFHPRPNSARQSPRSAQHALPNLFTIDTSCSRASSCRYTSYLSERRRSWAASTWFLCPGPSFLLARITSTLLLQGREACLDDSGLGAAIVPYYTYFVVPSYF